VLRFVGRGVSESQIEEGEEEPATQALEERPLARGLHAEDDVGLRRLQPAVELAEQLRRFLEVGIDQEHLTAAGVGEARHHGLVMAEIAGEVDHLDVRIRAGQREGP
jgi:hypothetical protein